MIRVKTFEDATDKVLENFISRIGYNNIKQISTNIDSYNESYQVITRIIYWEKNKI